MKRPYLAILLCFCFSSLFSQEKKGNELYDNLGYLSAAEEYQNMEVEEMTYDIKLKLANSYRLNSQFGAAEYWYAQIIQETTDANTILQYAQMLQSNGKCEDAIRWYKVYQSKSSDNYRSFIEDCEEIESFEHHPNIELTPEPSLNSDKHDFSAIPFKNGLLFTSMRKPEKGTNSKVDYWTNSYFSDLYFVEEKQNGYGEAIPLKGEINGEYHDGVGCFDAIRKELLFTRNVSKGKGEEGIKHLKIYSSKEEDGKWVNAEQLNFCEKEYSFCHPTISPDGQRLYFSSNRLGGFGGMDIYVVNRVGNEWGTPNNLGPIVNSSGNEVFPFMSQKGKLFYSSDGHKGIGGLDVFVVEKSEDKDERSWGNRKNVGIPFNTEKDDFGFYIDENEESGFLASNRKNTDDDIYSWAKTEKEENSNDPFDPTPNQVLSTSTIDAASLFICDATTKEKIAQAKVGILQTASNWLAYESNSSLPNSMLKSTPTGEYNIQVANGILKADASLESDQLGAFQYFYKSAETYALFVEAKNYAPTYKQYTGQQINTLSDKCIYLDKDIHITLKGTIINQRFKNPIKGVTIEILDLCSGETNTFLTGKEGSFDYRLDCNCQYQLTASKPSFETATTTISTEHLDCNTPSTIEKVIEMNIDIINPETEELSPTYLNEYFTGKESPSYVTGQVLQLNKIYYDFDKYNIRSDAAYELDYLAALMQQYPSMEIELHSHTDSRGKNDYNKWLSQFRANAARKYLLKKGIGKRRIHRAIGYGEERLYNHCANGERCTEAEHQENRRTEVKIVRFVEGVSSLSHRN